MVKQMMKNGMTKEEAKETVKAIKAERKIHGAFVDEAGVRQRLGYARSNYESRSVAAQERRVKSQAIAKSQWGRAGKNLSAGLQGKASPDLKDSRLGGWISSRGQKIANSKFGQAFGETFRGIGANIKSIGNTAYKNFASGDKAVSGFLDKSGIYKKPDHQEDAAKAAQAQAAMQEWQMMHPGQTPTAAQMKVLRSGKQPED